MKTTTTPQPGTALFEALLPLVRRNNPFARLAMVRFEHGRTLADAFIAGNTEQEIYACIRLARRYGLLPEGDYLDGNIFDAYRDHYGFDDADVAELRACAWELRDTVTEVSVATANVAA